MSQGLISKRGLEKPVKDFICQGSVTCNECRATYDIYHHYAHSENTEEQVAWLEAALHGDHRLQQEHKDTYHYPF
jgi:hypothetical protein